MYVLPCQWHMLRACNVCATLLPSSVQSLYSGVMRSGIQLYCVFPGFQLASFSKAKGEYFAICMHFYYSYIYISFFDCGLSIYEHTLTDLMPIIMK